MGCFCNNGKGTTNESIIDNQDGSQYSPNPKPPKRPDLISIQAVLLDFTNHSDLELTHFMHVLEDSILNVHISTPLIFEQLDPDKNRLLDLSHLKKCLDQIFSIQSIRYSVDEDDLCQYLNDFDPEFDERMEKEEFVSYQEAFLKLMLQEVLKEAKRRDISIP